MTDEKLSGKAGLDTTDFKTGIAAMNRELRVLESGFRASAASLGDWASDATGLEGRIKSLNSQMDIQRQKVALTRAEYERIKAEKGENSRAAQDLEIKLNKEVETLGKMESELRETEGALDEMQQGTEEAGESVDELGEKSENTTTSIKDLEEGFSAFGDIAKGAITIVAGLAAAVAGAALAIAGLVFNVAGAAADLVDMSAKTGISTTELQELSYIGEQVGTSLDTITGAQARLIRSMNSAKDGSKTQKEAFEELGVSVTDVNGQLRDQQDVFNDVIDALGAIENPAQRDALAMEIFGKSAQELNPLIKAGSDELARLADEAHDVGAVMSEDTVAGLEAFDDTMASIKAGLKGTLGTLAGQFLPIFQDVATALQNLFQSEQFKNGVEQFAMIVEGVVEFLAEILSKLLSGDLKGALSDIFGVENATGILAFFDMVRGFIFDTLIPFVTTHAEEIKAALIGIGAALAAAGIISAILGIVAAINPVTAIIAAIVAAVGLLAAAWEGNWGGIRDTVTDIWESYLQPTFQFLWDWLSTNIPAALKTLSDFWTGTLLPAIQNVWAFLNDYVFPLFQAISAFVDAVWNLVMTAMAGIWQNVILPALQSVYDAIAERVMPIFREISDFVEKHVQPIFEKFGEFLDEKLVPAFQGIGDAIGGVIDWLWQMVDAINNVQLPDWMTPGSPTPWEIGLIGINRAMDELNAKLPVLARGLQLQPNGLPLGVGTFEQSNNNSVQVIGNVIIRGDTPAGSLGATLKGRRY